MESRCFAGLAGGLPRFLDPTDAEHLTSFDQILSHLARILGELVSHPAGRGVHGRRGDESNHGWTRNTGRGKVRSGSAVCGEPFCPVLPLVQWRKEAPLQRNDPSPVLRRSITVAFSSSLGAFSGSRPETGSHVASWPLISTELPGNK